MFTSGKSMRGSSFKGLVLFALAAGMVPAAGLAQDCKLSVQATPQVLYTGQKARVNVLAHFPAPPTPNAPYAFASAAFDVLATDPQWSFVSDGAILGSDVLGIEVGQAPVGSQPVEESAHLMCGAGQEQIDAFFGQEHRPLEAMRGGP